MAIRKKVFALGDSKVIVLPAQICDHLNIKKGDFVEIQGLKKIGERNGYGDNENG